MDVRECDLVDCRGSVNITTGSRHIFKTPTCRASGIKEGALCHVIFSDPKYSKPIRRLPVWVQTDRGKEFLNRPF